MHTSLPRIALLLTCAACALPAAETTSAAKTPTGTTIDSWRAEADFRAAEPQVGHQAKWLETNLLSPGASDSLAMVLAWAERVPYVAIGGNANYAADVLADRKHAALSHVLGAMLIVGGARFVIEHPDSAADMVAQMDAAIRSMLVAYKTVQAAQPEIRYPSLDKLQHMADKGTLREHVRVKEGR